MAISLAPQRAAITSWVASETGLSSDHVHWTFEKLDVDTSSYVTLSFGPIIPKGIPYVWTTYDDSADPGEEITLTSCCDQQTSLHIQAFSTENAVEMLLGLRDSLVFEDNVNQLVASGISLFDPGEVLELGAIIDSEYMARAALDCRAYLDISSTRYTGYVDSIVGSGIITLEDQETEVEIPFVASGII
jgi:hypothetical protein